MSESKFSDEEIERMRRAQTRREKNIDPDKIQARKDFLASARSDGPEEFRQGF